MDTGCGAPPVVRKASPPLEHAAARREAHRVVYHPHCRGEHAHVTTLCKLERSFQMYKTSAWDLAVELLESQSTGSFVSSLKKGFTLGWM